MDGFKCELQEIIWKNLKCYSKRNIKAPLGYFSLMINLDFPQNEKINDIDSNKERIKDEGREF